MAKDKIKEEMITVNGMHCTSCVKLIENTLKDVKGVEDIKVDLAESKAFVKFDAGKTGLSEIRSKIDELGYSTDDGPAKKSGGVKQGIVYGLIPHIGCIAFIIGSVLGVTVLTQLFRPLLMNPYFFHMLVAISFVFATVSAVFYFRRQGFIGFGRNGKGLEISFSSKGIKSKWKYLSTLYGSTIGINLLLFLIVFPLLANVSLSAPSISGAAALTNGGNNLASMKLQVQIPCSGHAGLISGDLKTLAGVSDVQFSLPNVFDVRYDPAKTSKQQILALDVFKTYAATVLSESVASNVQANNVQASAQTVTTQAAASSAGSCCGSGGCGCGGSGGCRKV